MLGLIIILAVGAAVGYFSERNWGLGWGIVCSVAGVIIAWAVMSLILRKFLGRHQTKIQSIMTEGQNKVNRQIEMFQRRPPSSMNAARQIVEKIQLDAVRKTLAELENFKKFYIWNIVLRKHVNAMKVQLYYQLKEYGKVDELLPEALIMDTQGLAIKLVRMYKKEDDGLDKFYRRRCRRVKGEDGAFLASVYAWIKVKQNAVDTALEALRHARKSSDNQVLMENIDRLCNNKIKHFSNSGFGDMWYALALEEPKVKNQRQAGRPF